MSSKQPKWSIEDKTRIVLSVLRGEVTIAEASRQHAVSQTSIAKWRDAFLEGGQTSLAAGRAGPSSREEQLEHELDEVKIALGEAHAELRVWRKGGTFYSGSRSSR